jgi:hypothetical protein
MAPVVMRIAKYAGGCLASTLMASKILGPLIGQRQKTKTEEMITDER